MANQIAISDYKQVRNTKVYTRTLGAICKYTKYFALDPWHRIQTLAYAGAGPYLVYKVADSIASRSWGETTAWSSGLLLSIYSTIFNQNNANNRVKRYEKIKSHLQVNGRDSVADMYLRQELGWICDRRVARKATQETGYSREFENLVKEHKIRPWHIVIPSILKKYVSPIIKDRIKKRGKVRTGFELLLSID